MRPPLPRSVLALMALLACGQAKAPKEPAPSPPTAASAPAPPVAHGFDQHAELQASQALFTWRGALNAPPAVTRTKAEAKVAAVALHTALVKGRLMAELLAEHEADVAGPRGGSLGRFRAGDQLPDLSRALLAVQPGEVAALIESPFGFHVLVREPLTELDLALIWVPDSPKITGLAEAAALRLQLDAGASFAELARAQSDAKLAAQLGELARVVPGDLPPALETAAFALEAGQVSAPIAAPGGAYLVQRR